MFTGIIEEVGRVLETQPLPTGIRLTIFCCSVISDAGIGSSIAVNGTCLTATAIASNQFAAELSPETLARTNLGTLAPGALVNLERPLRFNGRLDGHFVLGHVDSTARVLALESLGGDNWTLRIAVPPQLTRYIVSKASLAVDGISLTVAEVAGNEVAFAIIPHTYEHTNLRDRQAGQLVNLEADILAKHIEKLVAHK
jgi:riboflavin synthase